MPLIESTVGDAKVFLHALVSDVNGTDDDLGGKITLTQQPESLVIGRGMIDVMTFLAANGFHLSWLLKKTYDGMVPFT